MRTAFKDFLIEGVGIKMKLQTKTSEDAIKLGEFLTNEKIKYKKTGTKVIAFTANDDMHKEIILMAIRKDLGIKTKSVI